MEDTSKLNIVTIDDKTYAKRIKHAYCLKKINDKYYLECDIKMRGNHYVDKKYVIYPEDSKIVKKILTDVINGRQYKQICDELIHTPTMRIPSPIVDSEIIYTSMRSTLMCALNNNVKTIIIPAFGGSTGMVPFNTIAREMYKASIQIFNININVHSWSDVDKRDDLMASYITKK